MAGDERKALAAGCDDYLAKPIVEAKIIAQKIERLLPGWRGAATPA
jgi:CheY-like chemotaxis protein